MNFQDYQNVQRVFRTIAAEWGCPVWMVIEIIQQTIDQSWEKAICNQDVKALWKKYFPNGKPSPEQYVLRLGHAYESGEYIPYLLDISLAPRKKHILSNRKCFFFYPTK